MTSAMIHEFGHNLGLNHTWEDQKDGIKDTPGEPTNNYMSYDRRGNFLHQTFTHGQIQYVYDQAKKGKLNQGSNFTYWYNPKNSNNGKTTNEVPFRGIVKPGQKVPSPIFN